MITGMFEELEEPYVGREDKVRCVQCWEWIANNHADRRAHAMQHLAARGDNLKHLRGLGPVWS